MEGDKAEIVLNIRVLKKRGFHIKETFYVPE